MEPLSREPGQLWKYNDNSPVPSPSDGSVYLILNVNHDELTCTVLHKDSVRKWPWSMMADDVLLSTESTNT